MRKFSPLLIEEAFSYHLNSMEEYPQANWDKKTLEMYDKHRTYYKELYEEYRISEGSFEKAARRAKREAFMDIILGLMDK